MNWTIIIIETIIMTIAGLMLMISQSAIALGGNLQSFLGSILLIQRATGDNGLRRAAGVIHPYQCPALHVVGKLLTY